MKRYIDITPKSKTNTSNLINTPTKNKTSSSEPNDGSFIAYDPKDSFSSKGTVRYGEETDVDDI
ncbi:hypothetical protein [Cellulosilyticum sp. I15G10I2]|uniref:hypothetical protein n=1 Tax=Cellulosilyticum sp. I15G10I2 TaxID=1892843 RepID=UPI00085BE28B|nr:hypothetical protein [Cellulosilyticum sp. I15G10I2]